MLPPGIHTEHYRRDIMGNLLYLEGYARKDEQTFVRIQIISR